TQHTPTQHRLHPDDTLTARPQPFATQIAHTTLLRTLQVTAYTVNDGNSGGNYTVTPHTASGTISKAGLDIFAAADSKIYDGTTSSTLTPTLSGLQPGDTVTGRTQAFASKNVLGTNLS